MADAAASGKWCVYMLQCRDGSLYTGVTTDLRRRMREHGTGRGAKYTRGRGPFGLCGYQDGLTREEALRLERRIKRLSVEEKRRFITGLVRPETSVSADRRRVAVLPSEGG